MNQRQLPVIDIRPCLSKDCPEQTRSEVYEQLVTACREFGFFYLRISSVEPNGVEALIDDKLLDDFQLMMKAFFQKAETGVLDDCRRSSDNAWGYFDVEFTKNKQDWKKGFDCGFHEASPIDGVNRWPVEEQKELQGFKTTIRDWMTKMVEIAEALVELILQAFKGLIDVDSVRDEIQLGSGKHTGFLRLNYYPECAEDELSEQFGVRRHTDAGLVTLLWQDKSISSLQALMGEVDNQDREELERDPRWIDVPPIEGTLVVNFGDMLQVLTNKYCKAALHRVKTNTMERFSAPFFYNPPYEANCRPMMLEQSSVVFRPINWGDFRRKRFEGDYADVGQEIQITDFTMPN
jgi:isopenicillin N synthase-like dioxygenase